MALLQKEAAEAAKLYEDFVESFAEDPAEKGPKAFVRGEVIQPGQRSSESGRYGCCMLNRFSMCLMAVTILTEFAGEPPRRAGKYVPKFLPPSMAAALAPPDSRPNLMEVSSQYFIEVQADCLCYMQNILATLLWCST